MPTAPDHLLRSATDRSPSGQHHTLRFAQWAAELRGDELADITFRGVLLLRGIRVVVRDQDWRTAPPHRTRFSMSDGGDESDHPRLTVKIGVRHQDREVDFGWAGEITFGPDYLTFTMDGTANAAFLRNRIGIVVLHPLDDAGRLIGVTSPDGQYAEHRLPTVISPHQPLHGIRAMHWSKSGLDASLRLSGDVFETEDQRNWTDASFKTYSTPLDERFPVKLAAGQRVAQSATLTVTVTSAAPNGFGTAALTGPITIGSPQGWLPAVGFACSTETLGLETELTVDGDTPTPATLLVELDLRTSGWRKRLDAAVAESARWGAPLDVRFVTDDPWHIPPAVTALIGTPVARMGVFDSATHVTEQPLWDFLVYESYRLPEVALVGGSRAHYAELNRSLDRLPDDFPAVTFSITPQMHASEREHIVDSLAGQSIVARNAVRLAGSRPVHIGPITLKPRFNAVGTTHGEPVVPDGSESCDDRTDTRQGTKFAAAWMLASVHALAVDGVASLTYFETTGPRGLRRDQDGRPYPVHRLASWLTAFAGTGMLQVTGDVPQDIHVLAADSPAGPVVLLSNLGTESRTLDVLLPGGGPVDAARLDARGGTAEVSVTATGAAGGRVCFEIRPDDVVRLRRR